MERESAVVEPVFASGELLEPFAPQAAMQSASTGNVLRMTNAMWTMMDLFGAYRKRPAGRGGVPWVRLHGGGPGFPRTHRSAKPTVRADNIPSLLNDSDERRASGRDVH